MRALPSRAVRPLRLPAAAALFAVGLFVTLAGCASPPPLPTPNHVVIVVEENHSADDIVGNAQAPYMNSLVKGGAYMTESFATTHPSQPNYLELFSGSTQGVTDDSCPPPRSPYAADNLATGLASAKRTFAGYSEGLPATGSTKCSSGQYVRKHNPWADFSNVSPTANRPFTAFPVADYSGLPTVSFVIPNEDHDMHDGTVAQADTWLEANIDPYVRWAKTHNSLLVLTFDEDDGGAGNKILTVFVGPMVKAGRYSRHITHDDVLRTIEDFYGAPRAGRSAQATPVTGIWK